VAGKARVFGAKKMAVKGWGWKMEMGFVRGKPPRMEVAGESSRARWNWASPYPIAQLKCPVNCTGPVGASIETSKLGPKRSASLDLGPLRARALASPPSRERRRLPGGESVSG
jgi:hypothetical protein